MGTNPEPARAGSTWGKWKGRREVRARAGPGAQRGGVSGLARRKLVRILTLLLMEHCVRDSSGRKADWNPTTWGHETVLFHICFSLTHTPQSFDTRVSRGMHDPHAQINFPQWDLLALPKTVCLRGNGHTTLTV